MRNSSPVVARFGLEAQAILRLGGPLLVNNLVIAGMAVTNTIAAGRVGPEPLAGVAVGVSYYQVFCLAGLGILLALPPIVAHAYGAGRDLEVGHRFRQGLWLSQMLALLLLVPLPFVKPVLVWFGTAVVGVVAAVLADGRDPETSASAYGNAIRGRRAPARSPDRIGALARRARQPMTPWPPRLSLRQTLQAVR